MVNTFFSVPVILILVCISLGVLIAVVIWFGTRLRYLTTPIYDHIIRQAEEKASQIIASAEEQGRAERAAAQAASEKLLADRKDADEKFHDAFVNHFKEIVEHARGALEDQAQATAQAAARMTEDFKKYGAAITTELNEGSERIRAVATEEAERMHQSFVALGAKANTEQQAISDQIQRQVIELFEKETRAVRDEIATYRRERIAALNQNMVTLVEETARLVLNKTLSLQEHRELILDALEEAKREGLFGPPPA